MHSPDLLAWLTFAFVVISGTSQAAFFLGQRTRRTEAKAEAVKTAAIDAADVSRIEDEQKALRRRLHDLVEFFEANYIRKDTFQAKFEDLQGQINRHTDELKTYRRTH